MGHARPILIGLLAVAGCVSVPAAPETEFRDRLLATIPEGVDVIVPVAFSRDGRHAAYVARRGEECRAALGDWRGKPYAVL